jgi:hypothetical protein
MTAAVRCTESTDSPEIAGAVRTGYLLRQRID